MTEVWRQLGRHSFFIEEDFLCYELGRMFSQHESALFINPERHFCCGVLFSVTVPIFILAASVLISPG